MGIVHSPSPISPAEAQKWLARACLLTGLALVGYGAAVYLSGAHKVWASMQQIGGAALLAGLAATLVSLCVRAARWQLILTRAGHRLRGRLQWRVYLAGLAFSSTPGKLGETSRALLLRPHGVAYRDSIAAFVCDRLSDVIGVAALGASAAMLGTRQPLLETIMAAVLIGSVIAAAVWRDRGHNLAAWAQRWRWLAAALAPAATWAALWRGPWLAVYIAAAVLAYGIQGCIFAAFVGQVHTGLGVAPCLTIFVNATLIGAASMVPGGLGTMDAALVVQLRSAGVPGDAALAAAIAARVCTLWFAWLLGLLALLSFSAGDNA